MPVVAPHIARPHSARSLPSPTQNATPDAMLGLLVQTLQCCDLKSAAQTVVDRLPARQRGCRVAVGLAQGTNGCRLAAISGMHRFDQHAELVRAIEAAMDESLARGRPLAVPPDPETAVAAKTHEQLARQVQAAWIRSQPLLDAQHVAVGALVAWGDAPLEDAAVAASLDEASAPVAAALCLAEKASQSIVARALAAMRRQCMPGNRRRWWPTLAIVALLFALPLPHRIRCDCVIEPVKRRYIAAPFDATLTATLVEPGDVVAAGQPLIELDGREIAWELASLTAEYEKAQKTRDLALAERKTSAAQLAALEIEQLTHRIALLEHRQNNLIVPCPVDGVVISGDLKRVEGVPVTTGQTLLEVAPLDRVIVEAAIPEQRIAEIDAGASAAVRLDAFPGRPFHGTLATIHPQAELRNAQQVFIGQLELDNQGRLLRPGMQGRVSINAGWATLGWTLFHRPYRAWTTWLGW